MTYNEDLLQFIWQHQLYDFLNLRTLDHQKITVINPGFLNTNAGPDFENCQIIIDETPFYGSIEIHINATEWFAHKHHLDKAYNNVILHVVYSGCKSVIRQDQTSIPTVVLQNKINTKSLHQYQNLMQNKEEVSCSKVLHKVPVILKNSWLDRLGIERLEYISLWLQKQLELYNGDWRQAFQLFLFKTFGAPINSEAFVDIGKRIPYAVLDKNTDDIVQLETILFGVANLLEPHDEYCQKLQHEYAFIKHKYPLTETHYTIKFGRMRPMSLPTIKLAQLAGLLSKAPDLLGTILHLDSKDIFSLLRSVPVSDYWDNHYTFKKTSAPTSKRLSTKAAYHIIINCIYPALFLYRRKKQLNTKAGSRPEEQLRDISAEKNSITLKMKGLGFSNNSAFESQALLQLYKTYCKPKHCIKCSIGKSLLLKNE